MRVKYKYTIPQYFCLATDEILIAYKYYTQGLVVKVITFE
jgi:hypothetical protein